MKTVKDYYEIAVSVWLGEMLEALLVSTSDKYDAVIMSALAAEMILEGRF